MCRLERWRVRTLRKKVDGMLYERTALAQKPEKTVGTEIVALREEDRLGPDLVSRDPNVLDFLGLADGYSERDLEGFLIGLGAGFCFVGRTPLPAACVCSERAISSINDRFSRT
jgi:predicted nuclease of restriction endonuclease-like (RecB) superfamily